MEYIETKAVVVSDGLKSKGHTDKRDSRKRKESLKGRKYVRPQTLR